MIKWKAKPLLISIICVVLILIVIVLQLESQTINIDIENEVTHESEELLRSEKEEEKPVEVEKRPEEVEEKKTDEIPTLTITPTPPDITFKPHFSSVEACRVQTLPGSVYTDIKCSSGEKEMQYYCKETTGADAECPLRLRNPPKNFNCSSVEHFKRVMKERRDRVASVCSNQTNELQFSKSRPKELFHFNKVGSSGLTWCPVFKAGSSTTNAYFCQLYYDQDKCSNKKINGANMWRFSAFFPPASKSIPRFVAVRHPFDRVLSAYRDKIEDSGSIAFLDNMFYHMMGPHRLLPPEHVRNKQTLLKQARDKADWKMKGYQIKIFPDNPYENPIYPTFEEFIRSLLTGNHNEHWSSINHACTPCSQYSWYDYILKVEDLDCEFNNMLFAINVTTLQDLHTYYWQTNENPARGGRKNDLYRYYGQLTSDTLQGFYQWYKEDCALFGYHCEQVLCEIEAWKRMNKGPLL